MTVEWSNSSEWVLVTGGCDGAIRFWDIRRAGCFRVLNQSHSQLGRRPPLLERSVLNKVGYCPLICCKSCQGMIVSILMSQTYVLLWLTLWNFHFLSMFLKSILRVQHRNPCQKAKAQLQKRVHLSGKWLMGMVQNSLLAVRHLVYSKVLWGRDYIQECCLVRIVPLLIMELLLG